MNSDNDTRRAEEASAAFHPQPYSAYKPSGVDWLGDVPAHWEVRRLRDSVAGCIGGVWGSEPNGLDDLPCVRVADFDRQRFRVHIGNPTLRAIASNERRQRILTAGDLLLEKSGGGDLQPVGVVMLYDHDVPAVCSNFIARLRVREGYDPVFLTFLHSTLYALRLNARSIKQTTGIQNLDTSAYLGERVCFPPLPEQHAIALYLDHADRRIQRYIHAKQKRITLLHEARQAIIHRTVTRGLDPDVPLKPSGVDWLGDVPAHWEVRRLRTVGKAIIGLTYSPEDVVDENEGTLVLRASNVSEGRIVYGDNVFVRCSIPDRLVTQAGDILICSRSGSRALIGKNARIDSESSGTTFGAFMTIFRSAHSNYLHHIFNSKLFEYQSGAFLTSTINQLTLGILYTFKIPWPPLLEQTAIAAHLDQATAAIDAAIDTARRQTELMRAYRASLIAHVVTGKLDVRAAAAQLPPESAEQEPVGR